MTQSITFGRRLFCSASLAALLPDTAGAATFPDHPIKLVVPFPPGAGTDATARIVAQKLGELVHQTIVVDNVAGANGLVGTKAVARSAPDGYSLLVAAPGPMAIAQFMFADMQYDPEADFVPVIKINEARIGLVVGKNVKATTLDGLVKLMRDNPGKLNAGNATVGSVHHLVAEMFKIEKGVDFTLVNYKGGAGALADLMGGHVDLMFIGLSSVTSQVKEGSLRALMTVGDERSTILPNVPCSKELGMPTLIGAQWQGIVAPRGTPPAIVATLHDAMYQALQSPEVKEKLEQIGTEVSTGSAADFGAFLAAERKRWGPVIGKANIKVD
jgi:tripartite-type tricarboxylate transporter receptor subunit TctC